MKRLIFISAVLLSAFAQNGLAQNYQFEKFTIDDGLMHNDVKGVFQDHLGVIYAANGTGFTRFFGDYTANIRSSKFIFKYGRLPEVRRINGVYMFSDYKLEFGMNEGRILTRDISNPLALANYRFVHSEFRIGELDVIFDWPFPTWRGYTWTYNIQGLETDTETVRILRYNEFDTLDIGEILKQLGIEMSNVSSTLKDNFIEDNHNDIWIHSVDGRIHRFDHENETFESINDSFPDVLDVFTDVEGVVWVSCHSTEQSRYLLYRCTDKIQDEFVSKGLLRLFESNSGELYFINNDGVYRCENDGISNVISTKGITSIVFDNQGGFVIVKDNLKGFEKIEGQKSEAYIYRNGKLQEFFSTEDIIYSVFIDRENCIWISTSTGLIKCTPSPIQFINLEDSISKKIGPLKYLQTNRNGHRIFISKTNGLLSESEDGFKRLVDVKMIPAGALPEDDMGNIYVADVGIKETKGVIKDLLRINPNLEISSIVDGDLQQALRSEGLVTIRNAESLNYMRPEDLLKHKLRWYNNSLYLFSDKGVFVQGQEQFELFPLDTSKYLGMSALKTDGSWFEMVTATLKVAPSNEKLQFRNKYQSESLIFDLHAHSFHQPPKLDTANVRYSYVIPFLDSMWVGFCTGGATINNGSIDESISYNIKDLELRPHTYSGEFMGCLLLPDSTLLYHPYQNGLVKFNPIDSNFVSFGIDDGLSSANINDVFYGPDSASIWIVTPFALHQVSVASFIESRLRMRTWNGTDGFVPGYGHEIVGDSILRVYSDGGYTEVDLLRLNGTVKPLIYFRGVRLFYEDVRWDNFHCSVDSANRYLIPNNISLPYNQNHLTFDFQAVSHTSLEGLTYKYKLDGQDQRYYTTNQKSVTYTNLRPGTYTFNILAYDEYGNESVAEKLAFTIAKPFWLTTWFITVSVFGLLLLVYGSYRWRVRNLKLRQKELELEVDNATLEIRNQRDEIQEQKKEVEQKKEQVEAKNHEILESINYAKKLQTAVLPPAKVVKEFFRESFLLYLPRDIVSGDFYWMESKGDMSYFAVADSTGHGVPGAMLSVIGLNGLNRALNEQKLTNPKDILTSLSETVNRQFEKSDAMVRDGMDICLCSLNTKTNKLTFAGANNPVWIARNGEMIIMKGDRRAIGHDDLEREFTQQEIQLEKGDVIYLASDGYQDQLGGENYTKFMTATFRNKLLEISSKPLDEQRLTLISELDAWKGKIPQTDDICVMSVRV